MDHKQEKYQTAYPDTYNIVKEYARENRKYQTTSEAILWETIRKNQLGVKFRRQHIIGDYIADFICLEKRLIIEIDGGYHNKKLQKDSDLLRSQWLYKQGYYVLRFTNDNVNNNIDEVRERIAEVLSQIQT